MSSRLVVIKGERFCSLNTLAEICALEVEWVADVYRIGLLGEGELRDGTLFVRVAVVERVVTIRKFQVQTGVELAIVPALLDLEGL